MALGLIARKIGMSRVFLPTGEAVAVTYLKVEDNSVVRMRTVEKDGYSAAVLGINPTTVKTRKGKEIKKFANQKEFRMDAADTVQAGATLTVEAIPASSLVTIVGTGKGKGFQGVMKRHHFSGGPASHGSHFKREPGSVGMRTWPGRIHAGKKLPGHMGLETVTLKGRAVLVSDKENKVLGVRGPIPGGNGSIVYITLEQTPAAK